MKIRSMIESELKQVAELWHTTKKAAYPYFPLEQTRTLGGQDLHQGCLMAQRALADFAAKVESAFNQIIVKAAQP